MHTLITCIIMGIPTTVHPAPSTSRLKQWRVKASSYVWIWKGFVSRRVLRVPPDLWNRRTSSLRLAYHRVWHKAQSAFPWVGTPPKPRLMQSLPNYRRSSSKCVPCIEDSFLSSANRGRCGFQPHRLSILKTS